MMTSPCYIRNDAGAPLAYLRQRGDASLAGLFWLGGFMSDMTGAKAVALADMAAGERRSFLRFDYSGHGASGGNFEDLTLSDWLEDAAFMFAALTEGPQIVAASSMGAYLALLLARRLEETGHSGLARIRGLVLLAPAVDMTEALLWPGLSDEEKRQVMASGRVSMPSRYDNPYVITRRLIEDGRRHLLLDRGIAVGCPVRILAGDEDADVPWRHALAVYQAMSGEDVMLGLIKGGDHRLSSPQALEVIRAQVSELARRADRR
jgi:pimeloyl-ACP methyl ester carboxylesterase